MGEQGERSRAEGKFSMLRVAHVLHRSTLNGLGALGRLNCGSSRCHVSLGFNEASNDCQSRNGIPWPLTPGAGQGR